jgi:hypothetical protein
LNYDKSSGLVESIYKTLGGSLTKRLHKKGYESICYNSVSFKNILQVLHYLDRFSLSSKYLEYVLMRKAYLLVQNKEHLTELGLDKLKKYQQKISSLKVGL